GPRSRKPGGVPRGAESGQRSGRQAGRSDRPAKIRIGSSPVTEQSQRSSESPSRVSPSKTTCRESEDQVGGFQEGQRSKLRSSRKPLPSDLTRPKPPARSPGLPLQ